MLITNFQAIYLNTFSLNLPSTFCLEHATNLGIVISVCAKLFDNKMSGLLANVLEYVPLHDHTAI